MSISAGPSVRKIVSVAECLETLTGLKVPFKAQVKLHREKLSAFLSEFNLIDTRQVSEKYPDPSLKLLIETTYHYYLTLNGSVVIISHGIDALIDILNAKKQKLDVKFALLNPTTLDKAMLKIQYEHSLQDYLKTHPDIKDHSPEEQHKLMLRKKIETIDLEIGLLPKIERMAIEYYEVVFRTQEMFTHLDALGTSLDTLATRLRTMTPAIVIERADESFAKNFEDDSVFSSSGEDLNALLSAKLRIQGSSDEEIDWDKLGGSSNRSSLAGALSPSLPAILRQFELQQSPSSSSSVPSSVPSTQTKELPRPDH